SQEFSLFLPILPSKFDKITGYLSQIRESIAAKADFSAQIQLKRIQSDYLFRYASAVALKLTHSPLEAISCAAALEHSLFQSLQSIPAPNPENQIWHHCTVSVDSRGWIFLELSDIGLAIWLEALRSFAPRLDSNPTARASKREDVIWDTGTGGALSSLQSPEQPKAGFAPAELFRVLYIHARCCNLLDRNPPGQAASPRWLSGNELRCSHPTERQLIAEFSDVLDYLSTGPDQSAASALKIALRLSHAFEVFHASCRLSWPESAPAAVLDPNLLAVRLGLITITQKLLQILLEQRLFVPAPRQL
ncbi:MAG: hypothetical protein ACKO7W_06860, partial [Elainella sp.]